MRVSKNKVMLLSLAVAGLFAVGAQAFTFNQSDQRQFLQQATANVVAIPAPLPHELTNAVIPSIFQDQRRYTVRDVFALVSTARKKFSATKPPLEPTRDPWEVQKYKAEEYARNLSVQRVLSRFDQNKGNQNKV